MTRAPYWFRAWLGGTAHKQRFADVLYHDLKPGTTRAQVEAHESPCFVWLKLTYELPTVLHTAVVVRERLSR